MIAYNESIRAFMQEIAEMQRNRAAFCNFIVAHLSVFSMDQCREKAEFKFALNENDPLLLFRAISQIHLMGTNAQMLLINSQSSWHHFSTLKWVCVMIFIPTIWSSLH